MGKTEIIAELAHLSAQDLIDVRDWLDQQLSIGRPFVVSGVTPTRIGHVRSPRLADPGRAADFRKHVTELPPDAEL